MRVGAIVTAHSMEVVPKINQLISRTTLWSPAILLWVLYTKGKIIVLESSLHPHIHCDIIHNSQDMETPGVLADRERIKKTGDAHTHTHTDTLEYCSPTREKKTLPLVTRSRDLEGVMLLK